jgi:hypothetical protein
MTTLEWTEAVRRLIRAIAIARDAYSHTRRLQEKLSDQDVDRLRCCELEIAKYLREAQKCVDRARSSAVLVPESDWRRVVLDLLRGHSLVWETLWIKYHGIPKVERGSGLGEPGDEITRSVVAAIEVLTATTPDLVEVDWNGREILRPATPPISQT